LNPNNDVGWGVPTMCCIPVGMKESTKSISGTLKVVPNPFSSTLSLTLSRSRGQKTNLFIYDNVRFYSGMQEVADHPSKFIRELSYRMFNPEEECAEAFVEWVKKREAVRQLVDVFKKIQEKKV
jgi:hypothetical protein